MADLRERLEAVAEWLMGKGMNSYSDSVREVLAHPEKLSSPSATGAMPRTVALKRFFSSRPQMPNHILESWKMAISSIEQEELEGSELRATIVALKDWAGKWSVESESMSEQDKGWMHAAREVDSMLAAAPAPAEPVDVLVLQESIKALDEVNTAWFNELEEIKKIVGYVPAECKQTLTRYIKGIVEKATSPVVEAAPAEPVAVKVCKMKESNGRVTWIVFLVKADDDPFRGHQIYSSEIEGRAEYEAARLRHFFGQGPEPDILAFDTAAPTAPVVEAAPAEPEGKLVNDWQDCGLCGCKILSGRHREPAEPVDVVGDHQKAARDAKFSEFVLDTPAPTSARVEEGAIRDAARYRWLRTRPHMWANLHNEKLDQAIDNELHSPMKPSEGGK